MDLQVSLASRMSSLRHAEKVAADQAFPKIAMGP
jgi:hypothetical protein